MLMIVEKILARIFEDVVRSLPQMKKDKTNCHPGETTVGLLEKQLKKDNFLYALVNNRKEEIHEEISKIAQVSLASLFAEGMEREYKDAMFVAGESGLEIGRFIRCLSLTNQATQEKLLAYFCGLDEAQKIQFINNLRDASKFDNSTPLIREVLAKYGLIPGIIVIPFEQRGRGNWRKAPNAR